MPHAGIAIVNTDPCLREVLCEFLRDAGYEVAIYPSHLDTYQHLHERQPALIVLNVEDQASWVLLNRLRFDPQTTQIPILITTPDRHFTRDTIALLHAQGCDVLELPTGFKELHARVARLCPLA
jgi:DNA-binding response OmpR family regulator